MKKGTSNSVPFFCFSFGVNRLRRCIIEAVKGFQLAPNFKISVCLVEHTTPGEWDCFCWFHFLVQETQLLPPMPDDLMEISLQVVPEPTPRFFH